MEFISCREAAGSAGITPSSMARWASEGTVSAEKRGHAWWIEHGSLTSALEQRARLGEDLLLHPEKCVAPPSEPVWTAELDAELLGLRSDGLSWSEIGRKMCRTGASCAGRWRRITLDGQTGQRGAAGAWSEEELAFVRENAGKMTTAAIAMHLERTVSAVYAAKKRLGVSKGYRGGARLNTGRRRSAGTRLCHDCHKPSGGDYRCRHCRLIWLKKNGVEPSAVGGYEEE